jgi:3-keto-disaccharide hydrolase/VCBS repeat protein
MMSNKRLYIAIAATTVAICIIGSAVFAASQNFRPDVIFKGSSLTGWHKLGQADWRADNGEIIASPKESGDWLMLDKGYQDIAFYASFLCVGACQTGVLLRAEKIAGGMKGIYVSLAGGDIAGYEVLLDAQGKETSRTPLGPGPGMARMGGARFSGAEDLVPGFAKPAPTRAELAAATAADFERLLGHKQPPTQVELAAATRPPAAGAGGAGRGTRPPLTANEWHTVQIILDADVLSVSINGRGAFTASTNDRMMGFGPIALYAGAAGEVRFKEVSYKDLNHKTEPKEIVSKNFQMQRISDFYYGWCAAVADINRDGVMDVIAGPFYYLGPDYTERHEFTAARTYNPSNQFSQGMVNFAYDFTGDGWPDILMVDTRPIYLYVNPRGESRRWDRYNVVPQAMSEIELLKDIDGDGKPAVLFGGDGAMEYAKPDPEHPTAPWIVHRISEKGFMSGHGMGVGDINGDGRMDIVTPRGWWEHPPKGSTQETWTYHAASFGVGGAEMGIYDVNGDGLDDVVTALNAHGWGLAWFEQKRDKEGAISFVKHSIMGDFSTKNTGDVTFSELHGVAFGDLDGDGIPDIITGKRVFSHLESYLDPDPYGPGVLYWYRTVRNPKAEGGAEFIPELIHNRSGVGSHLKVVDVDNDGALDVVTSTNRGTFIFWNKMGVAKGGVAKK